MNTTNVTTNVSVKRNEENPEPIELIAASIVKVADGIDRMAKSGLSPRAIVVLLHDATRVPMGHIERIINCAPALRKLYLRQASK
jgi:hypothetical protein